MKFTAVIFDIDNVLIDTRASYTDCIRKTVQTYLEDVLKFKNAGARFIAPLLTRSDVEQFKSLGGFNDDWDTCYGLLIYLLSLPIKNRSIDELQKQKNIPEFVKNIKTRPVGMKGLKKFITSLQRNVGAPFMAPNNPDSKGRDKSRPYVKNRCFRNDDLSLSRIARIFQKFYLGEFVWNEKLLIPRNFLKHLKRTGVKLGIVTGRNREEAMLALKRFKMDSLMDAMVTLDETPKNRKKPDPYGLLKAAELLKKCRGAMNGVRWPTHRRSNGRDKSCPYILYVGDLPDDMLAAKRAKKKIRIKSCGFLRASALPDEMKLELKKSGADFIAHTPKELEKIVIPSRKWLRRV